MDWSTFLCCDTQPEPVVVPLPEPAPDPFSGLPELDRIADYDEGALLDVQVGIVVLCAARADQVAVLSVPQHYDNAATLAWHEQITSDRRTADAIASGSPPMSYAAYWHPWVSVVSSQTGQHASLRDIPPDGPVTGMVAARELARGAWIAPAGVPLRGVVGLGQGLSDDDAARLFDAHANLVTHQPGAFTTLSAHTLTGDPQLLQLSVRRLVILLRRIALRLGARYTFEVNNDRFRQLVRMRFDRLLSALAARGALHAFRVLIDGGINTAEDQDNGRFIVALQIAPTSPIEFITVTLVRSGEGLLDVLEG